LRKQRREFWENAGKNDEGIRGTLFSWIPVLGTVYSVQCAEMASCTNSVFLALGEKLMSL